MRRVSDVIRKALPAKRPQDSEGRPVQRRDNATLVLECRWCRPRPDLSEDACLLCGVRAMGRHSGISKLLLCGDIDASYEGASLGVLKELANLLRLCEESGSRGVRGKGCPECSLRPSVVFQMGAGLPQRLWAKGQLDRLGSLKPTSQACKECVGQSNAALEEIASRMRSLEQKIARHSFLIVEAPAHA
jgi:hypothetical protein